MDRWTPTGSSYATAYRKSSRLQAASQPPVSSAQAERLPALLLKLQEESDELRDAATVAEQAEELADVIEVLKGIASELGQPSSNIETLADDKHARRGGFEAGIWLKLDSTGPGYALPQATTGSAAPIRNSSSLIHAYPSSWAKRKPG